MSDEQIEFYVKAQAALARAFIDVRPTDKLMQTAYEACVRHGIKVEPTE